MPFLLSVLLVASIILYFRTGNRVLWSLIGAGSLALLFILTPLIAPPSPGTAKTTAAKPEAPDQKTAATESGTTPQAPDADAAAAQQAALLEQQEEAAKQAEVAAQLAAEKKAEQEAAAAEAENDKKYGFHCLSLWDGSHPGIVRAVKDRLNDPDSFQHDETKVYPVDDKGRNAVFMTFRARNGFGGVVRGEALGSFDNASCEDAVAEILEQ